MDEEKKGVRNFRISVTSGISGYFAVMLADYEDMEWNTDVVNTGIGRYRSRDKAICIAHGMHKVPKLGA